MAIRSFKNTATHEINYGLITKAALRVLPKHLHPAARIKLARLGAASRLGDLAALPGSHLERLRGTRAGQWSIRINKQYRICFYWRGNNAEEVEIVDYH